MILNDVTNIVLDPPMLKILCLSCAYDKTFVCVRLDRPGYEESIVHFDSNGKILWQHQYPDCIDFFGMLNDREIIVLNVPKSKIDIINLQTHQIIQVNHKYL